MVKGSGFSTGSTGPVTVTLTNDGVQRLKDVEVSVTAPSGGTVTATSPVTVPEIEPGASATATFAVTMGDAPAGHDVEIDATATYRVPPTRTASSGRKQQVRGAEFSPSLTPYTNLSDAFNNVAITTDSDTNPAGLNGGFDGAGGTFSQESLDAATGVGGASLSDGASAGATVDYQGTKFTMPDVAAGTKDNVVASGQSVALSGTGSAVAFLASGAGATSGTVTINYSDGTSSSATISVPSWYYHGQSTGPAVPVVQSLGKNALKGHANPTLTYDLYDVTAPITAGKTVASVTLPNDDLLHVFAIAVAPHTPVSPIFSSFEQALDNLAITDESAPNPPGLNGGFDGGGNTFDQQALNAATSLNGAILSNGASAGRDDHLQRGGAEDAGRACRHGGQRRGSRPDDQDLRYGFCRGPARVRRGSNERHAHRDLHRRDDNIDRPVRCRVGTTTARRQVAPCRSCSPWDETRPAVQPTPRTTTTCTYSVHPSPRARRSPR